MFEDFTCESALIYYEHQILPRWKEFEGMIDKLKEAGSVARYFPFVYFLGQTIFLV